MVHGATNPEEAEYSYQCPHCGHRHKVTAAERERFPPERMAIRKAGGCDNCRKEFSYFLDENNRAATKKVNPLGHALRSQNAQHGREGEKTGDSVGKDQRHSAARVKEARRLSEPEASGPILRAVRAFNTLVTYCKQNPIAAAEMFRASAEAHRKNVDQFAEDFRVHAEKLIDQFSQDEYDRARTNLEKLVGDINEMLEVLEARIDEVRRVESLDMAREQIQRVKIVFPGRLIEQMDVLKEAIRKILVDAAPLYARHRELMDSYEQVKEETRQRSTKRLLKELYTEDGIRQFLDQYFRSRVASGADRDSRNDHDGR